MIIKLKNTNYNNFIYDNNYLEKIYPYKYLGINIHNQLNWNYSIEKRIIRGWKCYYRLENNCNSMNIWTLSKKKILFETLVTCLLLYGCEVWGYNISRESWSNIEFIQMLFINYNLNIKGNTPYPFLLIEVGLCPIERTVVTTYLVYTKNLYKNYF